MKRWGRREWVVHYVHRVAISNRRLLSIDHRGSLETSQLTFQYRPSDTGQLKTCTLSVEHFIQRFLQHVLPRGFVKVRYCGFFGATLRSRLAALQQSLLQLTEPSTEQIDQPTTTQATSWQDNMLCPKCGQLMLVLPSRTGVPPVLAARTVSLVEGLFQRSLCPPLCRSP